MHSSRYYSFVVFFILILFAQKAASQSEGTNPREQMPTGVSVYMVGPNVFGSVAVDHFINPRLNVEVGFGYIGVHAGAKYHFNGAKEKSWTTYMGASAVYATYANVGVDWTFYVPVGWEYIGDSGFNFAFELAPLQLWMLQFNVVGLKVGYRF